jgi:hypothetical protein
LPSLQEQVSILSAIAIIKRMHTCPFDSQKHDSGYRLTVY